MTRRGPCGAFVLGLCVAQGALAAQDPGAAPADAPALDAVAPEQSVPAPATEAPPPERRVRFAVGGRLHGGFMLQRSSVFLLAQSEVCFAVRLKVRGDELRLQLGLLLGYPDLFGGETNVSFRRALSDRVSLGVGAFAFWGAPSYFGGVELPLAMRLGSARRHEVSIALRVRAGCSTTSRTSGGTSTSSTSPSGQTWPWATRFCSDPLGRKRPVPRGARLLVSTASAMGTPDAESSQELPCSSKEPSWKTFQTWARSEAVC
nr:hypothetical protein Hi04_10k_c3807_00023 [uncultured bacterium]